MSTDTLSRAPTLLQDRYYQRDALDAIIKAHAHGRALVVLPTGSGKTEVFCKAIYHFAVPTLVLAHRKELLEQAKEKLLRYYDETAIGIVGAGYAQWERPIIVASVQTVRNHAKRLQEKGFGLVICDEAHHATKKNSYTKVFDALPHAFIVAFTATPKRLDGQEITGIFNSPVYEKTLVEMVREGFLCDLRGIEAKSTTSLDTVRKSMGDFNEKELSALLNTDARNRLVLQSYITYARGLSAICFAIDVAHAHTLASLFNEFGVASVAVDGKTPPDTRVAIIKQFEQGHIKVLVNCELLTEGFDAPYVQCVIMARPTLSTSLYMQMLGRGTRLHPSKQECLILDVVDNYRRHGIARPQRFRQLMNMSTHENVSFLEYEEAARLVREEKARVLALQQSQALQRAKEIAEGKQRDHEEKLQRALRDCRDVRFTELFVLGKSVPWIQEKENTLTLTVAYATLTLSPDSATTYKVTYKDTYSTRVLCQGEPLAFAKSVVEANAKTIEERVQKTKNGSATEKQIETLQKMRVAVPQGCTKARASELITARLAQLPAHRRSA